jgi:hypothetical protein
MHSVPGPVESQAVRTWPGFAAIVDAAMAVGAAMIATAAAARANNVVRDVDWIRMVDLLGRLSAVPIHSRIARSRNRVVPADTQLRSPATGNHKYRLAGMAHAN